MVLMIFYYIIIRIPLAYLFSYLGMELTGIWLAILLSHIVACLVTVLCGNHNIKLLERSKSFMQAKQKF